MFQKNERIVHFCSFVHVSESLISLKSNEQCEQIAHFNEYFL